MKIKSLSFGAFIACVLASCGGTGDGIKPASTSIQGDAGDYFSVVDKTYPSLSDDISDTRIYLEFQRNDSTMPLAESARIDLYVDWLDKDGNVIANETDITDNVIGLKSGDIITEDFIVWSKNNKSIVSFRVRGEMKYDGRVDNIELDDTNVSEVYTGITSGALAGTVGDYPVELEFSIDGNDVTGRYRYLQTGSGEWIPLAGNRVGKGMTLVEGAPGNQTGTMTLKFDYVSVPDNSIRVVGALNMTNGASHYVKLNGAGYWGDENASDADDSDSDYFDSYDSSVSQSSSASSSNVNIDNLLNQYEQALNDMIKYSKKMAQNDFSAAGQMAEASSKMMELAGKLEPIVDDMTPAQAQRFLAIGAKAAQSARP